MSNWVAKIVEGHDEEAIRLVAEEVADMVNIPWSEIHSQEDFRQYYEGYKSTVIDGGVPYGNREALLLVADLNYYDWEHADWTPHNPRQLAFLALDDWCGDHWTEIFQATIDVIMRDDSIPKKDKRWMRIEDV